MGEDTQKITLPCPLCERDHEYSIIVVRSLIMAYLSPDANLRPRRRVFSRAFTCPQKGGKFQAKLTLTETILDRIETVAVGDTTRP